MNNAKVSLIIPVYNGANFLHSAIDSALNQSYQNIEIIIVNDGSTDHGETKRIAESYGRKIRYFEKSNGGVASALNLGLAQMTGDYFSWLSHDDFLHPDKIRQSLSAINKEKFSCIVITDYWMEDSENRSKKCKQLKKLFPGIVSRDNEEYQYALINSFFESHLHMCSALIPSGAIKEIGDFDEKLATTQDYDFFLRLAKANYRFILLDEPLLTARHHNLQDSKTKYSLHVNELTSLYLSIFEHFKPVLKDLPIRLYFNLVNTMYTRGLETVCFSMLNAVSPVVNETQTTIWLYWENRAGLKTPEYIYYCWYSIISRNRNDFAIAIITPDTLPNYLPNLNSKYIAFQEIAHRADYIRFNLLSRHGGIWLDSDFVCFRSLNPIKKLIDQHGFVCSGYKDNSNNVFPIISFLASRKDNIIMNRMIASIDDFIDSSLTTHNKQPLWDEIGGDNLRNILLKEKEYISIDIQSFYPIPTHTTKQLVRDEGIQIDFGTLAYGQNISHSDFGDTISNRNKQDLFNPSTVLGRVFLLGLSDVPFSLPSNRLFISTSFFWKLLNLTKLALKKYPLVWKLLNSAKRIFYRIKYN